MSDDPAFVFRAAGSSFTSTRLEEIVRLRKPELDTRALTARMLLLPPFVTGETPWLEVRATRASMIRPALGEDARVPDAAEAIALTRRALERAVARSLHGVKRVAVLTGGGLDSSTLLALAVAHAQRTGGTAFGVALDFKGPGDDRPHLRALEAQLGCEILRVRPEDAAHRFGLLRSGVDAVPLTWPGGAMEIEMMARARAHGAECALSGAGADGLFDGDPHALAELVRTGEVRSAISSARKMRGFERPRAPLLAWLARPFVARAFRGAPAALREWRARRDAPNVPAWVAPRAVEILRVWREEQLARALRRDDLGGADAGAQARLDAKLEAPHLEHLAWLRHQEEIASGLPRRDPYLDPKLVATITRLPRPLLLHGAMRRGLFREAIRGLVPDPLRMRLDKAAFEPAFVRFAIASGGAAVLRPLAAVPHLAELGLVEPRRFREAFETFAAHPEAAHGHGWGTVWPALAVEAFLAGRRGAWPGRAGAGAPVG